MQLSLEVDNDFMDLYREVKEITGQESDSDVLKQDVLKQDVLKQALRGLINNRSLPSKISKAEKAKIEYINQTRTFIPKIIRRNTKSSEPINL